jgi:dTDP-4-dehydrorhamnose 3,5-epimerase
VRIDDLEIPGPKLIHLDQHVDNRGVVFEPYRRSRYVEAGIEDSFVQDTYSQSRRGVVRGLHLRVPHDQAKLVQVLEGRVWDVAVDARPSSETVGKWVAVELGPARQLYIPAGFAHGFVALEDAVMLYKLSVEWQPGSDRTIAWNDSELAIDWPQPAEPILSVRDAAGLSFADYLLEVSAS